VREKVLGRAVTHLVVGLAITMIVALDATIGEAGEASRHAAGLKSEKEEGRYVLALCARSRRLDLAFLSAKKNVEHDSTVENIDRYRHAFIDSHIAFADLSEAARVVVRKHGKPPNCFQKCPGITHEGSVMNLP